MSANPPDADSEEPTSESLEDRFETWPDPAGSASRPGGWSGPEQVTDAILGAGNLESDGVLFDAGCGTGKAGVALRQAGWTGHLVGLDLSRGMLDVSAATGAYDQLIKCSLYEIPAPTNAATAVVSSGAFTNGHVGPHAMRELQRLVKPAGLVSIVLRQDLVKQYDMVAGQLAQANQWNEIQRHAEPAATDHLSFRHLSTGQPSSGQVVVTWRIS